MAQVCNESFAGGFDFSPVDKRREQWLHQVLHDRINERITWGVLDSLPKLFESLGKGIERVIVENLENNQGIGGHKLEQQRTERSAESLGKRRTTSPRITRYDQIQSGKDEVAR